VLSAAGEKGRRERSRLLIVARNGEKTRKNHIRFWRRDEKKETLDSYSGKEKVRRGGASRYSLLKRGGRPIQSHADHKEGERESESDPGGTLLASTSSGEEKVSIVTLHRRKEPALLFLRGEKKGGGETF